MQHQPWAVELCGFNLEASLPWGLLIPNLEPSNPVKDVRREGEVVVALRLLSRVLYNNIDRLSDVSLFQIRIPDEIRILENLGRLELLGQNQARRRRAGDVGLSGA